MGRLRTINSINNTTQSIISSLTYNIEISDQEFELFRNFIYKYSGINLNHTKKSLLQTRLLRRLKLNNCNSFSQYYRLIKNDPSGEELIAMINAVSTNLTMFFREGDHFSFLEKKVLPELLLRKKREMNRRMRVWCAACSSGEEAYSIGITILRHIETTLTWDIKLLATDISTDILKEASEGTYDEEKVTDIPMDLLGTYFDKLGNKHPYSYRVKNELKEITVLRRLNLIDESYPFKGKFEFIFCRNVMIYFDKKTQEGIVNRFYRHLEDGGYLFIGHSESLNGLKTEFKYVMPSVYRKERT